MDKLPYVTGGGLEGRYNFVQLHFHWGSDSSQGSEHLINFRPYAAELHIVHYAQKYGTIAEATKYKDGLAVIGILIETQARDNVAFRHIVKQFSQILEVGVEANLASPIPLEDLLPDDTNNFYRYNGSLVIIKIYSKSQIHNNKMLFILIKTTPGCEEIVIWTVFDTPIAVSQQQVVNK
jgi:carbonic anhydrase